MKIEKMKKIKFKSIFLKCIYAIIVICVFYNIIFLLNTTITKNEYLRMFGITFLKMENNLMQNDLNENDLIITKKVNEKKLENGDIIAYTVNGQTRINKIINTQNGYTTKSNKNYYPDIEKISYNQIIGKVEICIPNLGIIIEILQSKITSIFIFLFFIFGFTYNRYIYIKSKKRARKKKRIIN